MNSTDPFEELVTRYYEPLFRFAMSLTRSESDACDLTQQTFYVWAKKGEQLRDASKAKSWLFTTLHHAFLTTRRKQGRVVYDNLESVQDEMPVVLPESGKKSDYAQALRAMAKVDAIYQSALILFYLEDCSYQEIGSILQVPVGTVKSRMARGIVQLRTIMESKLTAASGRGEQFPGAGENNARAANSSVPTGRTSAERRTEWDLSSSLTQEPLHGL